MSTRLAGLVLVTSLAFVCEAAAGGAEEIPMLCKRAKTPKRPAGAPKYSDVGMRLFRKHKNGEEIEAGKAFHITRAEWSYIKDKEYIKKVHELGWSFQGTTCAVTYKAEHAKKEKNGEPMLDHFKKKGRYWANMKNEAYRKWYVQHMKEWVDAGADSIQRDEPTTCRRTPVGVAAAFHKDVHARFEKLTGRRLPISCNLAWNKPPFHSRGLPVIRNFDFGMAEFYARQLSPVQFAAAAREAEKLGMALVYTGGGHMSMPQIRLAVAGSYANGINYIVPWDQFTGIKKPRLFAKPEKVADLYGFIRAIPEYLDGYEAAGEYIPASLASRDARAELARELFAGRAFTAVMVSASKNGGFGIGGNAPNGGGGIPRLYLTRAGLNYNVLKSASAKTESGKVEVTTFIHDGKQRIAVYRNGEPAGKQEGKDYRVQTAFNCLSVPFQGGNKNHSGDLAEFMVFRGQLPAERLSTLHAALKRKYLADTGEGSAAIPEKALGKDLMLHLSAETLAGSHKKGQAVRQWAARTGHVALVPSVKLPDGKKASAPTFVPKAINGRPAVRFDGIDDFLRIAGIGSSTGAFQVADGTGSGQLSISARAKPGDASAPVVLHLVEWSSKAKPTTVLLNPGAFFKNGELNVSLLMPAPYDKQTHDAAEKTKNYTPLLKRIAVSATKKEGLISVEVPALSPWGILVVSLKKE